jgi:predicted outer membrane repeat protein
LLSLHSLNIEIPFLYSFSEQQHSIMRLYLQLALSAFVACCVAQVDVTSDETRRSLRSRELLKARNLDAQGNRFYGPLYGIISKLQGVKTKTKLTADKFLCTNFGIDKCICDEDGLRSAIETNSFKPICVGTSIKVSTEIDVTDTSFAIFCDYSCDAKSCSPACAITGAGSNRIFSGSPSDAEFYSINFSKGSADNGGVASLTGGSTYISGCTLSNNKATENGGAIFASGSSTEVYLDSSEFKSNSAKNGGAVYIAGGATLEMSYPTFSSNTAHYGGALYVTDSTPIDIYGALFKSNTASTDGGAVFVQNSDLTVQYGEFLSNTASGTGGAISVKGSSFNVESTNFFDSSAVNGGALAFENGKSDMRSTVFIKNKASGKGSDIWIVDDASPALTGSDVDCASTDKVTFCGSAGISEFAGGAGNTQLFDNTNCDTEGSVKDPTAAVCAVYN